jgi:hypothetical protein
VRSFKEGDNGVSDPKSGVMVVGVGDCGWEDCDGPRLSPANARLIAAAPDLLAACNIALMQVDGAIRDYAMTRDKQPRYYEVSERLRAA